MPLIMQQQNVKAGETAIFNYNTPIDRWVVGISYWDFEMEKRDHHVRTLALNLQVNKQQPSPQQSVITARVDGTLDDDSAHHIAFATSSVTVCCVALAGDDPNLGLANAQGVNSGGQSPDLLLMKTADLSISTAFLSGFNLRYPDHNHHVQSMWASTGSISSSKGIEITGIAITSASGMKDGSGHEAKDASINGGLIAATKAETGLMTRSLNVQKDTSVVVDFSRNIAQAVVLLQSINVQFGGDDHHIRRIGGGTKSWTVNGSAVTLDSARAFMKDDDDSNHHQDDKTSSVTVLVAAVPA